MECEGGVLNYDCTECQGTGLISNSKEIQLIEFFIKNQLTLDFPELLNPVKTQVK